MQPSFRLDDVGGAGTASNPLCEADGEGLRLFLRSPTGFPQTHSERIRAAEANAPSCLQNAYRG